MLNKLLLVFIIIVFLTLLLGIKNSRRTLWTKSNTLHSRLFTLRAMLLIVIIIIFLVFSLLR